MASGDTLLVFTPHSFILPTGSPAAYSSRNGHPCLAYDDTTNEYAIASDILPRHYDNGGITIYLHYAMHSATSGDVDWDVEFERIGDQQQDTDSDGFATANSVDNTTVPGTAGHVDIVNLTFTDGADMDSIAVGEGFRVRVSRDAASDTATGDAQLFFMEVKET